MSMRRSRRTLREFVCRRVQLASEKQLDPGDRLSAWFMCLWGAAFGCGMFAGLVTEPLAIGSLILVAGVLLGFGFVVHSLSVLLRKHRMWFLPSRAQIFETRGYLYEIVQRRYLLSHYDRVLVGKKMLKNKSGKTYEVLAVELKRPDNTGALLLGCYHHPGKALDQAIGISIATGLDLLDLTDENNPREIAASSLGRLESEPEETGEWWQRPSVLALIAANMVPLLGIAIAGWAILPIMLLFWAENVVVGLMAVARFLVVTRDLRAILQLIPFFLLHYGGFCAGHGLLVLGLFAEHDASFSAGSLMSNGRGEVVHVLLFEHGLWIGLLALLASHLFSFFHNFIGQQEYKRANSLLLMFSPYKRVVVMHFGLLIGGLMVQGMHSPTGGLIVLVLGKISLDINAHLSERRRYNLIDYDAITASR